MFVHFVILKTGEIDNVNVDIKFPEDTENSVKGEAGADAIRLIHKLLP